MSRYVHVVLMILVLLMFSSIASAQSLEAVNRASDYEQEDGFPRFSEPTPIHVSDILRYSDEGTQALARFHDLKKKGLLEKNSLNPVVGDTAVFRIGSFNAFNNYGTFENVQFRLEAIGPTSLLWVDLKELSPTGRVKAADIVELSKSLQDETPARSLDPTKGIMELNTVVFGSPPNSQQNGKVNILWYDIRDQYDGDQNLGFIGGFVSPADLPGGSSQNRADILHIDTFPSLAGRGIEYISFIAAHEFQHLIRFNYDLFQSTSANIFQDEGQSEWASVMTGYPLRSPNYLLEGETNISLLSWRGSTGNVVNDYQRAGLFTNYLAEQIGFESVGAITRDVDDALPALQNALGVSPFSMADMILNFHTANLIQDKQSDSKFGYDEPSRATFQAQLSSDYDGTAANSTPIKQNPRLQPGGALFFRWTSVANFSLFLDVLEDTGGVMDALRSNLMVRVVLKDFGGGISSVEFRPDGEQQVFPGEYAEVNVIVAHVNPNSASAPLVETEYRASWEQTQILTSTLAYESGNLSEVGFVNLGADGVSAVRFEKPANAFQISEVSAGIYFFNQFDGGPPDTSPRDFRMHIWGDNGSGRPGEEIFSVELTDPRPNANVPIGETQIRFLDIDLSAYINDIGTLPDVFFVGFSNAGTDDNNLIGALGTYSGSNTSFLSIPSAFGDTGFRRVWDLSLGQAPNQISLTNNTLPVRVKFLTRLIVANESGIEIPEEIALGANYPNPFNPSTSIQYSIPTSGTVSLRVFDVLGRQVASLVDTVVSAGTHTISVDASAWSSGTYLYVLEAAGQIRTGKMMLLK